MGNDFVKKFQQNWSRWEQRFIPASVWKGDVLILWRERILFWLLFITTTIGPIALIPSLILAFIERLWHIFIIDLSAYSIIIFLLVKKNLSLRFRGWTFCLIAYLLGVGLLFLLGYIGAGYIWLFGASVMLSVLLGFRAALWSLLLNTITLGLVAVYIAFMHPEWSTGVENALSKWIVMAVNFQLLNAIVTLTIAQILSNLNKSLQNEQATTRALRNSDTRYRTLFENAPLGIFIIDVSGNIVEINAKFLEILGLSSRNSVISVNVHDFPPTVQSGFSPIVKSCIEDGKVQNLDSTFTTKSGNIIYLRYHLTFIKDLPEKERTVLCVVEDISLQKRQAEQLRQAQKMEALGILAGGIAHDLNNILNGIVNYPELLLLDMENENPLRQPLLAMKESGEKAAEIIQDMLTLARRSTANKKVTDLNFIIKDFLSSHAFHKIQSNHPEVKIKTDLAENLLNIYGSEVHISKSVMNLVINAAEAMPEGGEISIITSNCYIDNPYHAFEIIPEGEFTILEITDTGIGMNSSELERIFEPFYTKKPMEHSGTGLGMSVVWGTIKDHDGYIDIITKEGTGTTFKLFLPVTRQEKQQSRTIDIQDYTGKGESILIVDDSPDQRALAGKIMQRLGYIVYEASSGEKALSMIRKKNYDLLILDMIMPSGWDGLETYRQIRKYNSLQRVVIASGYSENERVEEMQRLGAGTYIRKPYTLEKIGLAVRRELERVRTDQTTTA